MHSEPRAVGEVVVKEPRELSVLISLCVFMLTGGATEKEKRYKLGVWQ